MNSNFIRDRIRQINVRISLGRIRQAILNVGASFEGMAIGMGRLGLALREVPPISMPWHYRLWFWFLDLFSRSR